LVSACRKRSRLYLGREVDVKCKRPRQIDFAKPFALRKISW
jgi:hypothetical protein